MRLILGSSSKIRQHLLRQIWPDFIVRPADIDEYNIRADGEVDRAHSDPSSLVLAIARAKLDRICQELDKNEEMIVITMDSVVFHKGQIREKPASPKQCRQWMREYQQYPVSACTGVVVKNTANGRQSEGVAHAIQHFRPIPEKQLDRIIEQGEILGCAGGYIVSIPEIQPYLGDRIGDLDTLMGFPSNLLIQLVQQVQQTESCR